MSWDAYVKDSLCGSAAKIDKGAIISKAADSFWAKSDDFDISLDEAKKITAILNQEEGAEDKAHAEGIHVAKEKYVVNVIDKGEGDKKEEFVVYARQGRTGISIAKTKSAFIVAHHGEEAQAGNVRDVVEKLAVYLIKAGY